MIFPSSSSHFERVSKEREREKKGGGEIEEKH
jgi:hypothetical protein